LQELLKILVKLKTVGLYHGSLHKNNILVSDSNKIRLSDVGYAYYKNHYNVVDKELNDFIDPHFLSLKANNYNFNDPAKKEEIDNYKEKFDVYSFGKVIIKFLEDVLDKEAHGELEKRIVKYCCCDDLAKRWDYLKICQQFLFNTEQIEDLYGKSPRVNEFWAYLKKYVLPFSEREKLVEEERKKKDERKKRNKEVEEQIEIPPPENVTPPAESLEKLRQYETEYQNFKDYKYDFIDFKLISIM